VTMATTYDLEQTVQDAWIDTIKAYQTLGRLDTGIQVRRWTDVSSLPPARYIMVHVTNQELQTGNWAKLCTCAPATVEIGVFSATVSDSNGVIANTIRSIVAYQMPGDQGFALVTTLASKFTGTVFRIGALKRIGTHDYNENPAWKIRYVTFELYGQYFITGYQGPQGFQEP